MASHLPVAVLAILTLCLHLVLVQGHGDTGSTGAACNRNVGVTLQAPYVPGSITVDGQGHDWGAVRGNFFPLYPALTDDARNAYPGGSMLIKVAHDGHDIFFLVQVQGKYVYNSVEPSNMAAIALLFAVGDDATYHNMGGCPESSSTCNATSCFGHEVDLLQFELDKAIPGRIYGENILDNINGTGKDSLGNLNDGYAWNPHCRYVDGTNPTGVTGGGINDWRGAWTHSTTNTTYGLVASDSPYGALDGPGTYTFEFARPLRTNDVLQQDAQFTIGLTHKMAAAFWYPVSGAVWEPYQHYSASCGWLPLEIVSVTSSFPIITNHAGSAISTVSLLVALASLAVAVAVGWWVRQNSRIQQFNPISTSL